MTTRKFAGILMGMGNPLLDISAKVGMDVLEKYGVTLDSAILAEEKHLPIYKELIENYKDTQFIAGGATQNAIRVAQWMLNSQQEKTCGGSGMTAFMGCIGHDDEYGKILQTCAQEQDGVYTHYMKTKEAPTGTCAVLIHGGERSLIANLGAANHFHESHLDTPEAQHIIQTAQFYYVAGFFLTVSVPSLVRVAEHALEHNKVFALNFAAPFIIDFFEHALDIAIPYADYIFCNEHEAMTFATKKHISGDLTNVALHVAALPKKNQKRKRTVIFTRGTKSTIVAYDGQIQEFPVKPLDKNLLVDTNGAGDAFVGGFLSQLIQNHNLSSCIEAGHYAATYIIQKNGVTLDDPCQYKN